MSAHIFPCRAAAPGEQWRATSDCRISGFPLLASFLLSSVLCLPSSGPASAAEAAGGPAGPAAAAWEPAELLYQDEFVDTARWHVEQRPGGAVSAHDNVLVIDDAGGCAVWFRPELAAPVIITYEATVLDRGGPHDRISDLNCFWMATDPAAPDGSVLASTARRTGAFVNYDALRLYYTGCGGNTNTTTRFRRYTGTGVRPLLPEHDLQVAAFLLRGNTAYRITLVAAGGRAQYFRDGRLFFDYLDPQPLTRGWFGFRTVHSRIEIRHFRVWRARPVGDVSQP